MLGHRDGACESKRQRDMSQQGYGQLRSSAQRSGYEQHRDVCREAHQCPRDERIFSERAQAFETIHYLFIELGYETQE
jgi:hypothetical protein